MADFHIRGRIESLTDPHRFVAVIVANPSEEHERWIGNSLSEPSATYSMAVEALRQLCVEMGKEIRARGDNILSVDLCEK